MNRKKLLVTASTFPRWIGDTEPRFVLDLSIELNKYFDVTVLAPATNGAKDEEMIEGIKVIRYHYFPIHKWETLCYPGAIIPRIREKKIRALLVPFLFLGLAWKLRKILSQYDLVHAHWLLPQGIVQSFFKKPYIVTGHGGDVTSLNKGFVRKLKIRTLRNAKGITVVSEALKSEVLKLYNKKEIHVVSMGCRVNEFSKGYYQENYFQQDGKKIVLFVGRLAEKKGIKYLIEAMKDIDAKLVIVGMGPLEKQLKQQVKQLVLMDKVMFLGAKTHQELKVIYASADLFIAPSVTAKDGDKEGFGLVILEAMTSGLPIVASDSGGIVDLITDGEDGFLVTEKDVEMLEEKIKYLLKNDHLRTTMKRNAEKKAKLFSYEKIAEKYKNIIV
jgi:Glycosyltransferase